MLNEQWVKSFIGDAMERSESYMEDGANPVEFNWLCRLSIALLNYVETHFDSTNVRMLGTDHIEMFTGEEGFKATRSAWTALQEILKERP